MGSIAMDALDLKVQDGPIDASRPIKVICIWSWHVWHYLRRAISAKNPESCLTIYEKNDDVGGVWYENRWVLPGRMLSVPRGEGANEE